MIAQQRDRNVHQFRRRELSCPEQLVGPRSIA
jgi:hypothetical protein